MKCSTTYRVYSKPHQPLPLGNEIYAKLQAGLLSDFKRAAETAELTSTSGGHSRSRRLQVKCKLDRARLMPVTALPPGCRSQPSPPISK
ncbi:hypothetical protein HaLaN_19842 [Haematococcus lacustris]|uniref:Uncharacterized protein n=1 Tax=Haematococcus lacustris TaxID=44745 RepID=A0A699ZK43_HAELA|nr:hypothetical protein HaLaN_19842 [Haematococcus lacustris]